MSKVRGGADFRALQLERERGEAWRSAYLARKLEERNFKPCQWDPGWCRCTSGPSAYKGSRASVLHFVERKERPAAWTGKIEEIREWWAKFS